MDSTTPGWNFAPGVIGYRWPAFGVLTHGRVGKSEAFTFGVGFVGSNVPFHDGVRALWGALEIGLFWFTARVELGMFIGRRNPMYTEILYQLQRSDEYTDELHAAARAAAPQRVAAPLPADLTERGLDSMIDDGIFYGEEDDEE